MTATPLSSFALLPPPLPEPVLQQIAGERGRKCWRLHASYRCPLPDGDVIEIPAGYVYDLASIPRLLWDRIGPHELSTVAPLIHDFIYDHRGELPTGRTFTKKEADEIFRALMERQNVPAWRVALGFAAVRLFGRFPASPTVSFVS